MYERVNEMKRKKWKTKKVNTRIYNLNSVPQITWFLPEDAIISSKTNPCSGSKKQKRGNGQSLK